MGSFTENKEQIPEMQQNLELLKAVPFLASFPVQALKILALLAVRGNYLPGDLLHEEGDDSDRAYLILHGNLNLVTKVDNNENVIIQEFNKGDFLGSLSLLGRVPALFNLTAKSKATVLIIGREQFSKILEQFPETKALSLKAVLKEIHQWERTNISEAVSCCFTRLGVTAL